MKKVSFLLVSGLLMLFTACQKEASIDSMPDSVSVTVKVDVPSDFSRAPGDGKTVNRCVLQVYKVGEGQAATAYGAFKYSAISGKNASFDLNLPKNTDFRFVLWADYVDDPENAISTDKHYTLADGLTNISLSNVYAGNDETRDAFYGVVDLASENSSETIAVTLKRPFAQLSIYSSDLQSATPQPAKVRITSTANNLVTGFNAQTGELSTMEAKFSYEAPILAEGYENQLTLDYLFAPADEAQLINFDVEFLDSGNNSLSVKNLSNIPLQKNYATKITGNFFSSVSEVDVTVTATVNAGFDGEKGENH